MFDIPRVGIMEEEKYADWVELCALFTSSGTISREQLADVVRDAGLIGGPGSDYFPEDETFLHEFSFSEQEALEEFSERVWLAMERREEILGDVYPFERSERRLKRRENSWQDLAAYTALLLADIIRNSNYNGELSTTIESDTRFRRVFEKIVEACCRGLFRGASVRFGWPIEPNWPTSIEERIKMLAEKMALVVEHLEGKVDPNDKDRTLDVAARLSFGDDGAGTIMFFIQCATGRNWKEKRGEPVTQMLADLIRWDAHLVRAVAIPWRLEGSDTYQRISRHFNDVVVLDRPRLMAGAPDKHLDSEFREALISWCEEVRNRIPMLR